VKPRTALLLLALILAAAGGPGGFATSLTPTSIELASCGKSYRLPALAEGASGEVLVSLRSGELKEIVGRFHGGVSWSPEEKKAVFTFPRGKFVLVAGRRSFLLGREEIPLPVPLSVCQGEPYVPLSVLPLLAEGRLTCDEASRTWYLDPLVRRLEVVEESKRFLLVMGATGAVSYRTFMLKDPDRFVIDVQNAHLDPASSSLKTKEITHPSIGKIRFDQFSVQPNVTRVVVPLGERFEVESIPSKEMTKLVFWVKVPRISAPGENFPRQSVTGVDVECHPSGVRVRIGATGPIQYQWHRLKPPDNRYFIDITNAVLTKGARKVPVDDYYVREVRVAQFQREPVPVVRVVVDLNVPAKVAALPKASLVNTLLVEVEHSEVDMEAEPLQGFGATSFPRKGYIICLDPGHGGWDPGAVNSSLKLYEKTATLDICLRLARKLKSAGWNVVLTRRKDTDVSIFYPDAGSELGARVAVANGMKAQIFVSLHCNSATNTEAMGTSVHWYKDGDLVLARTVRGPLTACACRPDRGLHQNRFYVLRHSTMPAILIETAFLSNATEGRLLGSPAFREKVAEGVYRGVTHYASTHLKPPKKKAAPKR